MPDGTILTKKPVEPICPAYIEAKAHRVFSLIAAAREVDDATYEYADGIQVAIVSCLIDIAYEEAQELVDLTT